MRKDLTFDECEQVLKGAHYGHLGCCMENEPFVFPLTYVYQYGYIYTHSDEGQKIDIMRKNPNVCFQVEHVVSGYEWESVMCFGTFEEITDPKEAHDIHLLLAEEYGKISVREGKVPVSPLLTEFKAQMTKDIKKHIMYRINIRKTGGKAEVMQKM